MTVVVSIGVSLHDQLGRTVMTASGLAARANVQAQGSCAAFDWPGLPLGDYLFWPMAGPRRRRRASNRELDDKARDLAGLPLQARLHALPMMRVQSIRFLNKVFEVQKEAGRSVWWVRNPPMLAFCFDKWSHGCPC